MDMKVLAECGIMISFKREDIHLKGSGLTDWEESFMIIYNLIALNKPLMWR